MLTAPVDVLPTPQPTTDAHLMDLIRRAQADNPPRHAMLDAEDIRAVAEGEMGDWQLLCAGLRIPKNIPAETIWMYGSALKAFGDATSWCDAAMRWRIRHAVAFKTLAHASEADNLITSLSELFPIERNTRAQYFAYFALLCRLIHLWILGASFGGASAAQKFSETFETVMASDRTKLDLGGLVFDALRINTKATTPTALTTPEADRIDKAVSTLLAKGNPQRNNQKR